MAELFSLQRFLDAQAPDYETVLSELTQGTKRTHWMWFIFPQLDGLARSSTARYYAIKSRNEAVAYLEHPVLGSRLTECTRLVLRHTGRTAESIFGYPDYLKFHSCMTLFSLVSPATQIFTDVLHMLYAGNVDNNTAILLGKMD